MSTPSDTTRVAYDLLGAARERLIRVLVVFLVALLSTIIGLRIYAFDAIETQALSRATEYEPQPEVIFLNPFEVILLQAKIGIIIGVFVAFLFVVYTARDSLKRRGYWIPPTVSRRKVAGAGVFSVFLFVLGAAYAYFVMTPIILDFVVFVAVEAGVQPLFRISSFVGFVLVYSLIFGLAAQLPLVMSFTVKTGIVSYRFYAGKWRHFVVIAAVMSALVTSPDPITQLVVLGPVIGVYFLGLGVAKVVARNEIRERERLRDSMSPEATREESTTASEAVGIPTTDSEPRDSPKTKTDEGSAAEPTPNGGAPGSPTKSAAGAAFSSATGGILDRGALDVGAAVFDDMRAHSKKLGLIFLIVSSVAFYWLIYYGIASVRDQTLSHMDPELSSQVNTVQLEIFEFVFLVVKYSAVAGAVAVVPFALYYSRRTLVEEGVVSGERSYAYYISRVGVIVALFLGGAAYAYYGIIPVLISILSNSIVESGMDATFTIGEFVDFVVILTVLVGVIAELPATMYFLVSSRLVRYETLKSKWRHFTIVVLVLGAVVTSPDPFTMMVVGVPLSGFYLISLGTTRVLCHRTIKKVRTERRELGLEA